MIVASDTAGDVLPVSRPRAMSSNFSPSGEPLPSERIADTDVRDDVVANLL